MAKPDRPPILFLTGAQLIWKNFQGAERQFNRAGDRNFAVVIPLEEVDNLRGLGWNVKILEAREEGDDPLAYLKVKIKYREDGSGPGVNIVLDDKRVISLGQESVELVDTAEILNADISLNPYPWDVGGKQGITAYLKDAYITIRPDPLMMKYRFPTESANEEPPWDED